MPLTLYVDGPRCREHLTSTKTNAAGLIPVAKGNGYGFSIGRLARRAAWMTADTIAVGTYAEIGEVESRFDGDILVLEPWRPFLPDLRNHPRIIHTVGRAADLEELGRLDGTPRVVLEALTSMHRHGFAETDLVAAAHSARGVRVEGHALHLPLGSGHQVEVERWLALAPTSRWYVSHLTAQELASLSGAHPGVQFRPRVGTGLWLGDRGALFPRATVLDVHPVKAGAHVGYRQRRIMRDGSVLVLSGGTAHGIGLECTHAAEALRSPAGAIAPVRLA